jgi:hypothetical protein
MLEAIKRLDFVAKHMKTSAKNRLCNPANTHFSIKALLPALAAIVLAILNGL